MLLSVRDMPYHSHHVLRCMVSLYDFVDYAFPICFPDVFQLVWVFVGFPISVEESEWAFDAILISVLCDLRGSILTRLRGNEFFDLLC